MSEIDHVAFAKFNIISLRTLLSVRLLIIKSDDTLIFCFPSILLFVTGVVITFLRMPPPWLLNATLADTKKGFVSWLVAIAWSFKGGKEHQGRVRSFFEIRYLSSGERHYTWCYHSPSGGTTRVSVRTITCVMLRGDLTSQLDQIHWCDFARVTFVHERHNSSRLYRHCL